MNILAFCSFFVLFAIVAGISLPAAFADEDYLVPSYSITFKNYEVLYEIESGLELSAKIISEISFENIDAKRKINSAQLYLSRADSKDEIRNEIIIIERALEHGLYKDSLYASNQLDTLYSYTLDYFSKIVTLIKEGKELEEKPSEKNIFCFFWCKTNTNGLDANTNGLDAKLRDLEFKIGQIEHKRYEANQEIQFYENNGMWRQNQEMLRQNETLQEQSVDSECKVCSDVAQWRQNQASQKQERLAEQRLAEGRAQAEQRQAQLAEQRLADEEIKAVLEQQRQAQLAEQRLAEERAQAAQRLAEERAQAEREKQRLIEENRKLEQRLAGERAQAEREQERIKKLAIQALEREREQTNEQKIETEKAKIRSMANSYAIVKGWMNGQVNYYVNPLPSYASQDVREWVGYLASNIDGKYINGVKMQRVYSISESDFSINWVKNHQEESVGKQVGNYLIVGLGETKYVNRYWSPFSGEVVHEIMYHEIGHAMGQDHDSDPNNVMSENVSYAKDYTFNPDSRYYWFTDELRDYVIKLFR